MPIERFVWTTHAKDRCRRRLLDPADVERAVRIGHGEPRINGGRADWIVQGLCADGRYFEAVYDLPHRGDSETARIVSVWDL
jgi:hypothetical protein